MTDLGDRTAKPHPAATLMVYKYLLQRAEMVWGVAWWLWALLWCNIADPFKLSACLSFPATRTQELAGRGVRKCTAGLEMDSWDEKASGWHPLIQIRQTKSPQQLLWSYSANFFTSLEHLYKWYINANMYRCYPFFFSSTCISHRSCPTIEVFVFPHKHLYPLCERYLHVIKASAHCTLLLSLTIENCSSASQFLVLRCVHKKEHCG